jgi:hypothetical protein
LPRAHTRAATEEPICNMFLKSRQKAAAKPFLTHRLR